MAETVGVPAPEGEPASQPPGGRRLGLAILPNGEAVRPELVQSVRIDPAPSLVEEEGERFAVTVELDGGEGRVVATGLTRADATDLGRRCARAVNHALGS